MVMEISAASCLTRLLSNAQLYVCLTVHFFSFKLSSMGVSGRWGGVHPKEETQFLASADTPVKQLWMLCVCMQSQEPQDARKGGKKRIIQMLSGQGAGSTASTCLSHACALRLTTRNTAASFALSAGTFHG